VGLVALVLRARRYVVWLIVFRGRIHGSVAVSNGTDLFGVLILRGAAALLSIGMSRRLSINAVERAAAAVATLGPMLVLFYLALPTAD
jgi:hypothetical protein